MIRLSLTVLAGIVGGFFGGGALAGEPEIVAVNVMKSQPGVYRFDVTVRHGDTGWDHYADGWEVVDAGGKVLGKRVLYHPHVDEQPFTRSLSGVAVPEGVATVTVEAHDKVHGWGGRTVELTLPR